MIEIPQVMRMASALIEHAQQRQSVVASNIANADTPGYRAMDIADFSTTYGDGGATAMRHTRPGHIGAPAAGSDPAAMAAEPLNLSPDGNGVSLETEMVRAIGVKREHDLALAIYSKSLGILRSSLGRR